eukprot:814694-Karenia_brevis.AAC.1
METGVPTSAHTGYGKWLRGKISVSRDFGTSRVVAPRKVRRSEVELPHSVPALPDKFVDPSRWSTLKAGRWRYTSEHINLKEFR